MSSWKKFNLLWRLFKMGAKRCSNIRGFLSTVEISNVKRCCGMMISNAIEEKVNLERDEIEVVDKFCYLNDVLSRDVGSLRSCHCKDKSWLEEVWRCCCFIMLWYHDQYCFNIQKRMSLNSKVFYIISMSTVYWVMEQRVGWLRCRILRD